MSNGFVKLRVPVQVKKTVKRNGKYEHGCRPVVEGRYWNLPSSWRDQGSVSTENDTYHAYWELPPFFWDLEEIMVC